MLEQGPDGKRIREHAAEAVRERKDLAFILMPMPLVVPVASKPSRAAAGSKGGWVGVIGVKGMGN